MKYIVTLLAFFCVHSGADAQNEQDAYKEGLGQLNKIVRLVKTDNVVALADLVSYPLTRPNPVADIKSKKEFIAYYPILFDKAYKQKLVHTHFDHSNTWDNYRGFGVFNGEIWLNDGKISAFNYSSPEEVALIDKITKETLAKMYRGIKPWKRNIVVCETPKLLIRVDLMDNDDLRYIAWNKPRTIADEPDLVLSNGEQEFQGTMGGVTYTFKNKDWTYVVDDVNMAESVADEGWFLRLSQGEKQIASYKCKVVK